MKKVRIPLDEIKRKELQNGTQPPNWKPLFTFKYEKPGVSSWLEKLYFIICLPVVVLFVFYLNIYFSIDLKVMSFMYKLLNSVVDTPIPVDVSDGIKYVQINDTDRVYYSKIKFVQEDVHVLYKDDTASLIAIVENNTGLKYRINPTYTWEEIEPDINKKIIDRCNSKLISTSESEKQDDDFWVNRKRLGEKEYKYKFVD